MSYLIFKSLLQVQVPGTNMMCVRTAE